MSVAGSGTGLRVILVCLIVRCTLHPNREFVGRGDLVDSLSSRLVTDSRLLPPRSGLERSDFVLWPIASFRCDAEFGRYRGKADIDQATPIKLDL